MNHRTCIFAAAVFVWMFAIATPLLADDAITYFSPGVRFGYNFGEGPTIGVKISLGRFTENSFYNITFGTNLPLGKKGNQPFEKYNFLEIQGGMFSNPPILSFGGGTGMAFFRNGKATIVAPKICAFKGLFAFATIDMVFLKEREINDFGFEFVLPVPIHSTYSNWGN